MVSKVLHVAIAAAVIGFAGPASAFQTATPTQSERINSLGSGIQMAQSCSSGMSYCSPGSYGPGGCYKVGHATCTAGLVCTGGTVACNPSNGSGAYCYTPGYGNCN